MQREQKKKAAPRARAPSRPTRRLCDCGQEAQYRLEVTLLSADLETEIPSFLDLCLECYALELDGLCSTGQKMLRVTRI